MTQAKDLRSGDSESRDRRKALGCTSEYHQGLALLIARGKGESPELKFWVWVMMR